LRVATPVPSASISGPEASATVSIAPSSTATISGSSGSSSFGVASHSTDQREAAKELRTQQKKEQEASRMPGRETSANPIVTPYSLGGMSAAPTATASPFLDDARELRKQEKKQQKHEGKGANEATGSVSPSPSMTPQ
jgi:hypothetical protein